MSSSSQQAWCPTLHSPLLNQPSLLSQELTARETDIQEDMRDNPNVTVEWQKKAASNADSGQFSFFFKLLLILFGFHIMHPNPTHLLDHLPPAPSALCPCNPAENKTKFKKKNQPTNQPTQNKNNNNKTENKQMKKNNITVVSFSNINIQVYVLSKVNLDA